MPDISTIASIPPQPYKNPVLDEIQGLSPAAKDALARAHQSIASIQNPPEATPTPMQPAQIPGAPQRLASPPAYTPKPLGGTPAPVPGAAPPMTPEQQGHMANYSRIASSPAGVSQIRNPWARVPLQIVDAIGSGLFPRIAMGIPGTEAHHQLLEHEAQNLVKQDIAQRESEGKVATEAANAGKAQAEIPHIGAETDLANAQANALPQVTADKHDLTVAETGKNQAETQKLQAEAAPLGNVDQLNGMLEQRWQVLNPGHPLPPSYALKPGATKVDYEHVDKMMEATEKAAGTEAQRKATEELRHQTLALAQSNQEANRELGRERLAIQAQNHHDAEAARGEVKMMIPGPNGQYTLQTFRSGQAIPHGAISPAGMNTEQVNSDKQEAVAKKAREDAGKEYTLAENLAAHPSPTNDLALVMRYIGATKPDSLGKLRLNQNEMSLVLGTRSTFGDLEALANKVKSGQMLTGTQRKDMLDTMKMLTGGSEAESGSGQKIRVQIPGHSIGEIPASAKEQFLKDHPDAKVF